MKVILIGSACFLMLGMIALVGYNKYSGQSNSYVVRQDPKDLRIAKERRKGEIEARGLSDRAVEEDEPRVDLPREEETTLLPKPPPPVVIKEVIKEPEPKVAPPPPPQPIVKVPDVFTRNSKEEKKAAIIPLSLPAIGQSRPTVSNVRSERWLPSHRLIPCRLVTTIETRSIQSPVIAMITEDVYHHGVLVIPALTEIHSTVGGADRDGNRVSTANSWRMVLSQGADNGKELTFSALPLHRAVDGVEEQSNLSSGLVGRLKQKDPSELGKFLALAGLQEGVEVLQDSVSDGGDVNLGSSAADVSEGPISDWINRNLERLGDDPFFLRVPGGTAFYLYTTAPMDVGAAAIGIDEATNGNQTLGEAAASSTSDILQTLQN